MAAQVRLAAGGDHDDLGYHIVWSPKYCHPFPTGPVQARGGELIGSKCAEHGWVAIAVQVEPDQVHLLVKARPRRCPSSVANRVKGSGSHVARQGFAHLKKPLPTLWSRSFFPATVGAVSAAAVERYLDTRYERAWRKGGCEVRRSTRFQLRPTAAQRAGLDAMLCNHRYLYTAALRERRDCWRHPSKTTARYGDQCAQLKARWSSHTRTVERPPPQLSCSVGSPGESRDPGHCLP